MTMATVCLVNYQRAVNGLPPIYVDSRLQSAAQGHAEDMVARGYFAHTSPEGCGPICRAVEQGYRGGAAENIAYGYTTPNEAVTGWMNSPGHRANILTYDYWTMGSGTTSEGGGMWVHTFGTVEPQSGAVMGLEPQFQGRADPTQPASWPAKLKVLRAGVKDGNLDLLADITARADGDKVNVEFHARGERYRFTATVRDNRLRIDRKLPRKQRSVRSGIVTLSYAGGDYQGTPIRSTEVRLRAASGKAQLKRGELSVEDGVLSAAGTVSTSARGVVRLQMTWDKPSGGVGEWEGRATIKDGRWKVEEELPAEARGGGYLTMQFTGYMRRNMRGEQTAKQVLAE